jgi:hypothetical protein
MVTYEAILSFSSMKKMEGNYPLTSRIKCVIIDMLGGA